jgi:hypothetical protein
MIEDLPGIHQDNRDNRALCHLSTFKTPGLKITHVVVILGVSALRENDNPFSAANPFRNLLNDTDGLADVVQFHTKTISQFEYLVGNGGICFGCINNKGTALFMRINNAKGIVFSLMIRTKKITAFLREILQTVGFCKNTSLNL